MKRPWMFVTADKIDGLRSLAEVREGIKQGRARELWQGLVAKVEREMKLEPITMRERNRSFYWVATTANRITDAALVALVAGEQHYADAALRQIDVLFDSEQWPDWADKAHIQAGLKADLRHGQLSRALGMAYDWLYGFLTEEQRRRIVDGVDRCAVQRFKAGLQAKEHWAGRRSNWMTCVMGGFGILGMALGPDHPDAAWLVEVARPRMEGYMNIFGPEGEFNESVQYSGSIMYVVDYFTAERYVSAGKHNPPALRALSDFCRWYMYCTVPPGRVLGFGDPGAAMAPVASHLSAVAAALRDPMIQWFYLQYADLTHPSHRRLALELLWYDPTIEAQSPDGRLPLGRAYHAQAKIISSRTSWEPKRAPSIVYAKAGKEDIHCHADWGQVCIDGLTERLIVDLGSPPGYPRYYKERHYNYQQWGHNVFVFGQSETGGIPLQERRQGKIVHAEFDDTRGGAWTMDLSDVYGNGSCVLRHVIHLLSRIVVVLDEAELTSAQQISLRWHTITPAELSAQGSFTVRGKSAALVGRVMRLDGRAEIAPGRHEYLPPYNKDRFGNPYRQRREPFVEITARDDRCRVLSAFCVVGPGDAAQSWEQTAEGWTIETPEGSVQVSIDNDCLKAENVENGHVWNLRRRSPD